jgi:hypothetical protein
VLAHGESVHAYYVDLRDHILDGAPLAFEWKIPDWALSVSLWKVRMEEEILSTYQRMHDCGKPFCRQVDENGRSHFPGHAKRSEDIWRQIGGSEQVAILMGLDMEVHTMKAEDLEAFCERPEAASLLITGLCEIHSNAAMFGGIESTSFKMKWKHLDRRGKQIERALQAKENSHISA